MNLALLKKLVRILEKSGVDEIEVEEEGLRVRLAKNSRGAVPYQSPAPQGRGDGGVPQVPLRPDVPSAAPAADTTSSQSSNVYEVKSPIVGTFYRAPAPDADPYVEVGEMVQPKAVVCIIEAMKLMNEIETDAGGRIVKILVENGQPVEYNQVLFLIELA